MARLEGSGDSERAYTLATEAFREELEKVPVSGRVTVLREQRLDEKGRVRAPKSHPGIVSLEDSLGNRGPEADLAVEPIEGLQLLVKGQGFDLGSRGGPEGEHVEDAGYVHEQADRWPWSER